jgi:hypothetical protein
MALPLSLVQPFRQGQLSVGAGWRAFFAPFNQSLAVAQSSTILGPTIYDLEVTAKFTETGTLPTGWFDLGYVDKVKFSPGSKIGSVSSGYRNAVRAKYRGDVAEKFSIVFKEMGRLQLKIATGEGVFNLLKSTAPASTVGPLSSSGIAAIPMASSGYVANGNVGSFTNVPILYVPSGSGALFPAGTYIVADQDYLTSQFGLVGDAAINVFQGAVTDVDFTRKTSDYVATVRAVVTGAQDALVLTGPIVGGGSNPTLGTTPTTGPSTGAKVQAITGFASRAGGTTLTEWSCILVQTTIDGSQILLYYPRVAPDQFSGFDVNNVPNITSMQTNELNASFESMAFDDPLDGETVVRYSAYYPHVSPSVNIQI